MNKYNNMTTYMQHCCKGWRQYMLKCKAEYLAPRRQIVAKITIISCYFQFY